MPLYAKRHLSAPSLSALGAWMARLPGLVDVREVNRAIAASGPRWSKALALLGDAWPKAVCVWSSWSSLHPQTCLCLLKDLKAEAKHHVEAGRLYLLPTKSASLLWNMGFVPSVSAPWNLESLRTWRP